MIFAHTFELVIAGKKTQTRRLYKSTHGHVFEDPRIGEYECVYCRKSDGGTRFIYEVGKTYAVQPGRTLPTLFYKQFRGVEGVSFAHEVTARVGDTCVTDYSLAVDQFSNDWQQRLIDIGYTPARIKITGIRREDVRQISHADVLAEGFDTFSDFFETWVKMHDKKALPDFEKADDLSMTDSFLATRPAHLYQAWVLDFELVNRAAGEGN